MQLITTSNAKTVKGEKRNWLTGVMYLDEYGPARRRKNYVELCPWASRGCFQTCLRSAGRGRFPNVKKARKKRTDWLHVDRNAFVAQLHDDIGKLVRKAERQGMTPAIRLNGTSDLPWYTKAFGQIPQQWPTVQFYDYTKSLRRASTVQAKIPNYSVLFSRHEDNAAQCKTALQRGVNVAIVVAPELYKALDFTHLKPWGYAAVDGDADDLRFLDPSPAVVVLKAKGKATADKTGFVIRNIDPSWVKQ